MVERIMEMTSENLNIDRALIQPTSSFKGDLGIDSLDLFELVMALERSLTSRFRPKIWKSSRPCRMSQTMWRHTARKGRSTAMQTEITELLGIQYPIIQGGMAWVAEHHLAAAVSEAGGLGLIGAANAPAEWVREQIRAAKNLTEQPFGVNIMLMSPYADEVAQVVAEEGVKVVTTGAGSPEKYMERWKQSGIRVIPVVASVALAKRMERCGADAVVAEGCESGGHVGESTTMALVPQVVDAVQIPVIAAGGIADGRGIAAAFMLGAKAVQMGTRFIATQEAQVHGSLYKNQVLRAKDIDTRVTGRSTRTSGACTAQ